jgi:hypothetical protein
MSAFKDLYDYCQTLAVPPKISRNVIRDKAVELSGKKVSIVKVNLDTEVSRGFFLSAGNLDSPLVRQAKGSCVIALARGMNPCWERFVQVKELMHLFDTEEEMTSSGPLFQSLLSELEVSFPRPEISKQRASETKCIGMALACLCPEKVRLQYIDAYERKHIDYEGIALQLRIPKQLVPSLLNENFARVVVSLCSVQRP